MCIYGAPQKLLHFSTCVASPDSWTRGDCYLPPIVRFEWRNTGRYLLLTRQEKFKIKRSRIMWYIEWYSESPYELPVLYWCVRLLQVIIYNRDPKDRRGALQDLFDTHGVIIIIRNVFSLQLKINHDMSKLFICNELTHFTIPLHGNGMHSQKAWWIIILLLHILSWSLIYQMLFL